MHIVLIGLRGSGKSTIAKALSNRLHLPIYDTDALIESRYGPISEIFALCGETRFREMEKEIIAELSTKLHRTTSAIIATGGGAPLLSDNVLCLRKNALVFFLDIDPNVAYARLLHDFFRPALTFYASLDEMIHLDHSRRSMYYAVSDVVIDANQSVDDVCEAILSNLNLKKKLCTLLGSPVSHSLSPFLFNSFFSEYAMPYEYAAIDASHDGLCNILRDLRSSYLWRGGSVTIPYKVDIIPFLDEIDVSASAIGAVNTVLHTDGRLFGFNTDWLGILAALHDIPCGDAVIIGSGGAARACVYALQKRGDQVTIVNRTPESARALAEEFHVRFISSLNEWVGSPSLVIQATSVGMDGMQVPLSPDIFDTLHITAQTTVFDLVYTPKTTPFLQEGKKRGCKCIYGVDLFVHQFIEQFFLLFGVRIPVGRVYAVLEGALV